MNKFQQLYEMNNLIEKMIRDGEEYDVIKNELFLLREDICDFDCYLSDSEIKNILKEHFIKTNPKYKDYSIYFAIAEIFGFEYDIKKDGIWLVTRDDNDDRIYVENVSQYYEYKIKSEKDERILVENLVKEMCK
jgi:hypothetical protein